MAEVSESVGRYLRAIYLVTADHGQPAKTGELADLLDVTAASVTEMLATLEDRGLGMYEKYQGATLTDAGEAIARELLWKQCVAENFLMDDLGVGDERSQTVSHALSNDVATQLSDHIDHPCDGCCDIADREYSECRDQFVDSIGQTTLR